MRLAAPPPPLRPGGFEGLWSAARPGGQRVAAISGLPRLNQCTALSSIVSNIQRHARESREEKEDWLQFCHSVTIV